MRLIDCCPECQQIAVAVRAGYAEGWRPEITDATISLAGLSTPTRAALERALVRHGGVTPAQIAKIVLLAQEGAR